MGGFSKKRDGSEVTGKWGTVGKKKSARRNIRDLCSLCLRRDA